MNLSRKLASLAPRRLAWVVFSSIFVGALVSMSVLYSTAVAHKERALRLHVRDLATAAAALVDPGLHESLRNPEDHLSPNYLRAIAPLVKLRRGHPGIQYLWTVRVNEADESRLVLQTSVDETIRREQLALGRRQDLIPFLTPAAPDSFARESFPALRRGEIFIFPGVRKDEHGASIEARAPLFDGRGTFIGYAGVDYALDSFQSEVNLVRYAGLGSLGLALVISALIARTSYHMRAQSLANLQAAQEQRDRADRANHEKSELLAIASHDLKNPLSSIVGMSELMLQARRSANSADGAEEVEVLTTINGAARHMAEIVRGILANEGLDQGALVLSASPCDVVPIAESVRQFNRPAALRKRQELVAEWPSTLPASVDAKLLREAFDNYVSNAVKYSPPGGRIVCRLELVNAGTAFEFSVQDQGPGLSAADQAKLFRKFTRLTPRPTGAETSTGLGLSIVKTIVELHGGEVGCQTSLGHGARFWFRVPARHG